MCVFFHVLLLLVCGCLFALFFFFFFKQKTAYEMRISDWSSDVCSSDLAACVSWPGGCPKRWRWRRPPTTPSSRRCTTPSTPPCRTIPNARALTSRSEERRVGKECVSTCRSRLSTDH